MPNFPSIYLELQELWKRIRNNDSELAVIKDQISDLQAEDVVINSDIDNLQDITSCITHKNTPYEATIISCSLEQGQDNIASGNYSHAEGTSTFALGNFSHSEGCLTKASGSVSHAEGYETHASGGFSHAEGHNTRAIGNGSHSEGQETHATGNYSHAEGLRTIASASYQHVQGKYNQTSSTALMIIGNGTDSDNRSNALFLTNQIVTFFPTSSVNDFSQKYGLKINPNSIATPGIFVVREGADLDTSALFINQNGIQFNDIAGFPHDEGSTLSTYEQGTWTPAAVGFSTGSSNGYYTKIGNAVHITLYINSCSLIESDDYISGLPFAIPASREVPVSFVWRDPSSTTREVINTGYADSFEIIRMSNISSKDDEILASCTYLTS